MTTRITIESDDVPEELAALVQPHNAGVPALEPQLDTSPEFVPPPWAMPEPWQLKVMENHPEDFQFHNAGRPAVDNAGGNFACLPALPLD